MVALSVAIPIGIYSAMRQDTAGDYIARSSAYVGNLAFGWEHW